MQKDTLPSVVIGGHRSIVGPVAFLAFATIIAFVLPESPVGRRADGYLSEQPAADEGPEEDRGREADSPAQIPRKGWKDVLWRTYEQIGDDRLLAVAAGVVFYGLLALFPAISNHITATAKEGERVAPLLKAG